MDACCRNYIGYIHIDYNIMGDLYCMYELQFQCHHGIIHWLIYCICNWDCCDVVFWVEETRRVD